MVPPTQQDEARSVVIGARLLWALIPIGVACATGIWTIAWSLSQKFTEYDARFEQIEQDVTDRYTLTAASENAMREALSNPGHRVPDPRNPGMFIEVRQSSIAPMPALGQTTSGKPTP